MLCFLGLHHAESANLAYLGKYGMLAEILSDDQLSRDEKVRLLKQWHDDKKAYVRASDEGMPGEDGAELLRQIKKALLSLQRKSVR